MCTAIYRSQGKAVCLKMEICLHKWKIDTIFLSGKLLKAILVVIFNHVTVQRMGEASIIRLGGLNERWSIHWESYWLKSVFYTI